MKSVSIRDEKEKKIICIKVIPEGRKSIYLPDRGSLKAFIINRKLEEIHNFIPRGGMLLGADHDVNSVLRDIDKADRLAIFTDDSNMGHSLALIDRNRLECYDIGKISEEDLEIEEENRNDFSKNQNADN